MRTRPYFDREGIRVTQEGVRVRGKLYPLASTNTLRISSNRLLSEFIGPYKELTMGGSIITLAASIGCALYAVSATGVTVLFWKIVVFAIALRVGYVTIKKLMPSIESRSYLMFEHGKGEVVIKRSASIRWLEKLEDELEQAIKLARFDAAKVVVDPTIPIRLTNDDAINTDDFALRI